MTNTSVSNNAVEFLRAGILKGDRVALGRAITLIESRKPSDNQLAIQLLDELLPQSGKSIRIGITGVPGVGKSTFIEQFGLFWITQGKRVAVLSVDPSSTVSKGSILGDKTRMTLLSRREEAFIRPSPSQNTLGGVASTTRESILLCEAAGFDVILIETVGVGQSETAVKGMVDVFLLMMLAGGGDELQGIKRGIMEMADLVIVNKADGENVAAANRAKKEIEMALHLMPPAASGFMVPTLTCSSFSADDMPTVANTIKQYLEVTQENGFFTQQRKQQTGDWLDVLILDRLKRDFYSRSAVEAQIKTLKQELALGALSPRNALQRLFENG